MRFLLRWFSLGLYKGKSKTKVTDPFRNLYRYDIGQYSRGSREDTKEVLLDFFDEQETEYILSNQIMFGQLPASDERHLTELTDRLNKIGWDFTHFDRSWDGFVWWPGKKGSGDYITEEENQLVRKSNGDLKVMSEWQEPEDYDCEPIGFFTAMKPKEISKYVKERQRQVAA